MNLIFDLDGTLVDSRIGIQYALEQAVRKVFPERDMNIINFNIGPPVRTMFDTALQSVTSNELDQLERIFREIYDQISWKKTSCYEGVRETLSKFVSGGFHCYIVTNKPEFITKQILEYLDIAHYFTDVISPDSIQPAFQNKAECIFHLLRKQEISPDSTISIGDSSDDYQAAEKCGLEFIGVEYGYGNLTDIISIQRVQSFAELLYAIQVKKQGEFMINRDIFEDLFVLELANNHLGDVNRGLRIIKEFSTVVRYNDVRAAIKLQLRDVKNFIHKDFINRTDIRYIKKTLDTNLSREEISALVEGIRRANCVRVATPFDEESVELCVELGIEIIKVASSDVTDWLLLEKIAKTRKPVLVSTGGSSLIDIDNMVLFFEHRNIPLAINHCVSIYPAEDADIQLNQIDFLKKRYPGHIIGLSTHEYNDWRSSMLIAYAKGARTFERHIDIKTDDNPISPYCSTPEQIAEWFQAYKKAVEMCGASGDVKALSTRFENDYLTALVRGVYAKFDLPSGHKLTTDDYYLAIPLQKGQLSCRELLNDQVLATECKKDMPIMVDAVDSLYNRDLTLRKKLYARGL